jgi:hypothetical protein
MKVALECILTETLGLVMSQNHIQEHTAGNAPHIPIDNDTMLGAPEIYAQFPRNLLCGLAFAKSRKPYVSSYLPNRVYVMPSHENIALPWTLSAYAGKKCDCAQQITSKP